MSLTLVSESSEDDGEFPYQLVSFPGYENNEGKKAIDIVLASWMSYKKKKGVYVTKFAPPPYSASVKKEMHLLLKTYSPAPEIWPEYEIFHGNASKVSHLTI